ncbi:MAG: 5'/3'-nucleotidase SurE [Prevotella sp.]|nr:5'/3'-nucleotidase SurE [Prevotella sp.]
MTKEKPLILIANDDGYAANGIRSLVQMVAPLGNVLVCAPDGGRSGYSCAFTASDPLTLRQRESIGDVPVWSCTGTPVDCVKIAIDQLLDGRMPDLVLGGINHGDNSTVNNHYSGTVGIAKEGCLKHIPSIAFSTCDYDPRADLTPLTPHVQQICRMVLRDGLPKGICLNVNFPVGTDFKGVRVCRMTFGQWLNEVDKRHHERGYDYYWMVGHYSNEEPEATDTDQWALHNGYIAVTPTNIDVTAYDYMQTLRGLTHRS